VGLVERVGSGVSGWRVGQRVAGPAFRDAYATYVLVGSERLVEVPDVIEDGAAVSLVRAGQVALGALDAARLVEGEGLLVTAAAGAVGQLAVQLALLRGDGRVVSAVSSEAKATALRAAGHPEVATYAELASVEPVDAALDGVGGPVQDTVLSTLRPYGRLVTFGATGGPVTANELRMHSRSVIGFNMAHLSSLRAEAFAASRGELFERCRRGEIRPAVHAVLPLAEAGHAHRIMESRTNLGKVLLIP
jgi:NADPH:quinone reductase-like Zn-dependent oxidoreductase